MTERQSVNSQPAGTPEEGAGDLAEEAVTAALGDRPVRTLIAAISSEAEAMRWCRAEEEVPEGAVVVAQHQIGLRDRNGLPWPVEPQAGLAFSVILKPHLAPIRAGRLYLAGVSALLDALPGEGMAEWPDTIRDDDGGLIGGVVTRVSAGVKGIDWCIVTFYVVKATGGRAQLAAQLLKGFDEHWAQPDAALQGFFKERCRTIGRRIRATFLPLGPKARRVEGEARDITGGGGLITVVEEERKVTLQIADIGRTEYLSEDGTVESEKLLSSPLGDWPLLGDVAPPSGEGWTP